MNAQKPLLTHTPPVAVLEDNSGCIHEPTVHFDSVSKLHEAAAELSLHDSEGLPAMAAGFLRRLGSVVGLPALAEGKNARGGGGDVSLERT